MLRAVLDSSVLVSAFLKPSSLPATLLAKGRDGSFDLHLSRYILDETAEALLRPRNQRRHGLSPDEVRGFCADLARSAQVLSLLPTLRVVPNDPNDDPIVATAVAAKADYLVTGDRRHLLPLGAYRGVRIITPRQLLDLLPP